ncbi:N-acetyl-gamma-glutamyl-phosphate reductase [Desulfuromonas versatilis]|uniref:N-acetyl-gamma-glutamyl-phosphate reductase n=1 Tax=Desulfuromonas versatilis TaxID=2802975 RepID=A0ABN6E2P9_9BACT|nr:N-acetyl-gamma-glutamyl-phosphate reductase [Desulfuromonas versatilis]BCR05441.1 N-acetyl-gamma-glutamyl-phosphate reductase [Desulfuromonas versatilis]
MIKVAIVGASGYTGVELIRLLANHPQVEIACLTSRQNAGEQIAAVFPSLLERITLACDGSETGVVIEKADVVFTALPHQAAMAVVPDLLAAGKKVIDLSADYRLRDAAVYEAWYQKHSSPELLKEAVYGLPEIYREQVRCARLVANPGCYPTSVALALAPLLKRGLIDPASLIVDSKSGTSGAGRSAKVGSLFCEVNEGFQAYGVAKHRHTPEIEQTLGDLAGKPVMINFTPHLLPVNRGILSTCYASLQESRTTAELLAAFREEYADEPFVRVHPAGSLPNVAYVRASNYCDLGVVSDSRTGRVIVVSAIDNLVKGAAGQAVQNMNLMLGFEESAGLTGLPVFP